MNDKEIEELYDEIVKNYTGIRCCICYKEPLAIIISHDDKDYCVECGKGLLEN